MRNTSAGSNIAQMIQAMELEIPTQQTELVLPQADDIRINYIEPVNWPSWS